MVETTSLWKRTWPPHSFLQDGCPCEEESEVSVLEMVKEEYTDSLSVTVIHGLRKFSEAVKVWCEGHGWKYMRDSWMAGSEDQCVVLLGDRHSGYLESISRGRNLLVMVTTQGER